MNKTRHRSARGFTIVEVLVAVGVLAVTTIAMTQAMLILNRNSAIARVKNLGKAMVLGRIQEIGSIAYKPTATPPVVPTLLNVGTTSEAVTLGDSSAEIGSLPGTLQWTVASVGSTSTRSVKLRLTYTYMGRAQSYEVLTYRSPDD